MIGVITNHPCCFKLYVVFDKYYMGSFFEKCAFACNVTMFRPTMSLSDIEAAAILSK